MANLASAAGNNGVSGATATTTARRNSVAKTTRGFGSAVSASTVYSDTKNLRFAYPGVECDAPARTRT